MSHTDKPEHHTSGGLLVGYSRTSYETGLPIGTLYSMVSRKQIPHVRLGPRLVRFDLEEIRRWIEKRRVPIVD